MKILRGCTKIVIENSAWEIFLKKCLRSLRSVFIHIPMTKNSKISLFYFYWQAIYDDDIVTRWQRIIILLINVRVERSALSALFCTKAHNIFSMNNKVTTSTPQKWTGAEARSEGFQVLNGIRANHLCTANYIAGSDFYMNYFTSLNNCNNP